MSENAVLISDLFDAELDAVAAGTYVPHSYTKSSYNNVVISPGIAVAVGKDNSATAGSGNLAGNGSGNSTTNNYYPW